MIKMFKRSDRFFNKTIWPLIILFIFSTVLVVATIWLELPVILVQVLSLIVLSLMFLYCVFLVGAFLLDLCSIIAKGAKIHAGHYSGNDCFKEIDDCLKYGDDSNKQYRLCIYYINKIYSDSNPKMREIIEAEDIVALYQRKDLLEKEQVSLSHFVKVMTLPLGTFISLALGQIFQSNLGNVAFFPRFLTIGVAVMMAFIAMALAFMFIYRSTKGQLGSYRHKIKGYELKKIDEHLCKIYDNIENNDEIKMSLQRTQRVAASLIARQYWKSSAIHAGKEIMAFNTDIIDVSNCIPIEADVENNKIIFMLDRRKLKRKKDGANKKITEQQFSDMLSHDYYRALYKYLKKYYGRKMVLDETYVVQPFKK